jgi:small subunit ribosomal protein S19e
MASIHDIEPAKIIEYAAKEFSKKPELAMPEWASFVKSGAHVERPPTQENWWHIRQSAILRTIFKDGPVGVSKLRTKYGGRKNRGLKPHRFYKASGKIIRTMLQQLEKAGLIQQAKQGSKGRIITSQGQSFLDNLANQLAGVSKKKPAIKVEEKKEVKETPKIEETKSEPVKEELKTKEKTVEKSE